MQTDLQKQFESANKKIAKLEARRDDIRLSFYKCEAEILETKKLQTKALVAIIREREKKEALLKRRK